MFYFMPGIPVHPSAGHRDWHMRPMDRAAGGELLEVKFCGSVEQPERFRKYNMTGYDRFVGIMF